MSTPELTDIARRDTADGIAQQVVGAVIEADGKILLLQRPVDDFRGGTWELPSGKVERDAADLFAALRRVRGMRSRGLATWRTSPCRTWMLRRPPRYCSRPFCLSTR